MILHNTYTRNIFSFAFWTLALELLFILLNGCAQENPLLYDPTKRDSSVTIRYINMCDDGNPRLFSMDGLSGFGTIPFGISSNTLVNPLDSVHYELSSNGNIEYSTKQRNLQKRAFFRGTVQTFISGFSKGNNDSIILVNTNTSKMIQYSQKSTIHIINMIRGTESDYDITIGCQNGIKAATSLSTGSISQDITVDPGNYVFTLIESTSKKVIGTFADATMTFGKDSTYTVILGKRNYDSNPRLFVLNDLQESPESLKEWNISNELTTIVHSFNASSNTISTTAVLGNSTSYLANTLSSMKLESDTLSICNNTIEDKVIITNTAGNVTTESYASFSPKQSYTIVVCDSLDIKSGFSTIVKHQTTIPDNNQCSIRIINSLYKYSSIGLSLAGRSDINGNYSSGTILSSQLFAGDISKPILIPAGNFPLTIQTTKQPQSLINQYISFLEGGKNYILVITDNSVLVYDESDNTVKNSTQGIFIQVAHASIQESSFSIGIHDIVRSAQLTSNGLISTVIPANTNVTVTSNQNSITISENNKNTRCYFIVDNTNSLRHFPYSKDSILGDKAGIRMINLANGKEVDLFLDFDINGDYNGKRQQSSLYRSIPYLTSTGYHRIEQDRKLSYSILEWGNPPSIMASLNNVLISLGKNYNVLVIPEKNNQYRTILRQEF